MHWCYCSFWIQNLYGSHVAALYHPVLWPHILRCRNACYGIYNTSIALESFWISKTMIDVHSHYSQINSSALFTITKQRSMGERWLELELFTITYWMLDETDKFTLHQFPFEVHRTVYKQHHSRHTKYPFDWRINFYESQST